MIDSAKSRQPGGRSLAHAGGGNHWWSAATWCKLRERVTDSGSAAAALAVADQAINSGTRFVTAVLIGRHCGIEVLGLYALVTSAMGLLLGTQEQLLTAPYTVGRSRRQGDALRTYNASLLTFQTLFMLVTMAGMLFLGSLVACGWGPRGAGLVTAVVFAALPFMMLRAFLREVALANFEVLTVVWIDLAVCLTQLVTLAVLCFYDVLTLPAFFGATGIACLLVTVQWFRANQTRFRMDLRRVRPDWKATWRFGRWSVATHLAATSTPLMMPWLLYLMHGERAAGVLAACSVVVGVANILLGGLSDFVTPRAARAYVQGGRRALLLLLDRMGMASVLAISAVCIVSSLYGDQLINRLYDGQFPDIGRIATLLTLAVLANAFGYASGSGLWALDEPRANFVADVITFLCAGAASLMLIPLHGAEGAATATLAAAVAGALVRRAIFHRVLVSHAQRDAFLGLSPDSATAA